MPVGLADMMSLSTLSMYMSRTGSRFGGGHQVLLSRKGLGLKSQLFTLSKKYSLRRKRREKSLMSALSCNLETTLVVKLIKRLNVFTKILKLVTKVSFCFLKVSFNTYLLKDAVEEKQHD